MAGRAVAPLLGALVLSGCASAGPRNEDGPRVPVFQAGEETPCDYETIGPVSAQQRYTGTTDQDYRLAIQRELGRAGAEAGADAVIVEDYVRRLPFATSQTEAPRSPLMFEGTAVRWIIETCKLGARRAFDPTGGRRSEEQNPVAWLRKQQYFGRGVRAGSATPERYRQRI